LPTNRRTRSIPSSSPENQELSISTTNTYITQHAFNKSQIRPVHHVRPRRRWKHAYVTSKTLPSISSQKKKLTHNRPPLHNPHRLEKHQSLPRLATRLPLRLTRQLLRGLERKVRGPQEKARGTTRVLHRRRQQLKAQRQLQQPQLQAQRFVWFAVQSGPQQRDEQESQWVEWAE
jgi:hypothetical protein